MKVMIKRVGNRVKWIRRYNEIIYNEEMNKITEWENYCIRAYGTNSSEEYRQTIEITDIPEEELTKAKRTWNVNGNTITSGGMTGVDLENGYKETERANV